MKHLTKIFVGLAIVLFIVGYYLQATDHDSQGISFKYIKSNRWSLFCYFNSNFKRILVIALRNLVKYLILGWNVEFKWIQFHPFCI